MRDLENNIESLRKKITALEKRQETLSKKIDRLSGKTEQLTPGINAIMQEGLPLELFTRIVLMKSEYEVHGYYPFDYLNRDGTVVERSVDIYASRDSTYTVPEGQGDRSGESWIERDNLLVEVKQRKSGVSWLFCQLPASKGKWSIAGKDVPIVNAGFELRPGDNGPKNTGNPKDIKNAISQLNQAYIPFLIDRENTHPGYTHRFKSAKVQEHTWLVLVTNAILKSFEPTADFESLCSGTVDEDKQFKEVPWIVYQPEPTLSLLHHQKLAVSKCYAVDDDARSKSIPEIMADHSHEVHIVNYSHLGEVIALIKDPPRLETIQVNFSIDGGKPQTIIIK